MYSVTRRVLWPVATLFCVWSGSVVPFAFAEASNHVPASDGGQELTLEQALALAFRQHPDLRAATAEVEEAEGRLIGAETIPNNPTLAGGGGARLRDMGNAVDLEVELSQQLEIAGQRGDRTDAAQAALAAERARLLSKKRLLAARVQLAFTDALEARAVLDIARSDSDLATRLMELAERRLARGAANQLDVNTASAEAGRADARHQLAEASYAVARTRLAEAIGGDPLIPPSPAGKLAADFPPAKDVKELARGARENRPELLAFREMEKERLAEHELARAEAWPDLTVRAFARREGDEATIVGGGLSIPIPLFQRNQGRIAETRASSEKTRAERQASELAVAREVAATHVRYQAATTTAERFRKRVIGTLGQNLDLIQRAFDAGKITWPEVLLLRRTFVESQRELAAAEAEARRTWVELELASGQMRLPRESKEEQKQ